MSAALSLVLVGGAAAAAAPSAHADAMSSAFAAPARSQLPLYRFWNGGGSMDPATFNRELDEMAANGAGGLEASTFSTQNATTDPSYTTTESFGTPLWTQRVTQLIQAGNSRGLRVDEIYSPRWSASINTITPDGPGSAKEITFGRAWVNAGAQYSGAVPTASLPSGVTKREPLATLAYRCVSTCGGTGVAVLDQSTVVDLTSQGSTVNFTAPDGPAGTQWVVIGAWMNGTGQTVGAGLPTTSYLLDHFSINGWNALKDYWETKVLTPEMKSAWAANGGSLFFDSLELNRSGAQVRHWAPNFLNEFQARRGYSLVPYLPAVAVTTPAFEFQGALGARIREDYNQTLSDLFRDYHMLPAQDWAHSLGLTLRGQAYSSWGPSPLDVMDLWGRQDIAEGEDHSFESEFDLNFLQTRGTDVWRAMSSAVEMAGKKIVSTECCAERPALGYPRQVLLSHMNHQFAAGVNQIVYHGWSHKAPKLATSWPGWGGFNYGVSDDYGPENPTWGSGDDKAINEYVGRAQTVLRTGRQRSDIAIYHAGKGHSAAGQTGDRYVADLSIEHAGYRYGFMNHTMVASDAAKVSGGRLDPDGEQFKAFIVDDTPNVNNYTGFMDLASATRIAQWADAGLPIVFVGPPPSRTQGNHPDQDAQLAAVIAGLLAKPNVTQVATQADVPAALRAAGVKPATDFTAPSTLISTRRETDDTNYYFFYNEGAARANTTMTLTGAGIPYKLDAYTGKVTPIAAYERMAGGVKLTLSIATGDAAIVALTAGNDFAKPKQQQVSATSTTADSALFDSAGDVAIRASAPGSFSTTLSDGRVVSTAIPQVPAPTALRSWTLNVISYQQGLTFNDTAQVPMGPYALTAAANDTLPDWRQISGLANRAGIGTYSTSVDVGPAWTGGTGAYLDLGSVPNSDYTVSVNGIAVPYPDQIDPSRIDIGAQLKPGVNQISVRVATLLGNARGQTLMQGLVGPVRVVPYGQAAVYSSTAQGGTVGGSVPATLSLSLVAPASFGAFTPGFAKTYTASTTANVISTAGDATLSVSDPGHLTNGAFSLPEPLQVSFSKASWTGPVSNDPVTIGFSQHIGANDALRTGSYSKTLTFTLATTTP